MKQFTYFVLFIFLLLSKSQAQVGYGGSPRSFNFNSKIESEIPIVKLPSVNMMKIAEEDDENEKKGKPLRIGMVHDVEYNLQNSGTWQELQEGRLWKVGFYSKEALAMSVFFNHFDIPKGADLFVYNASKDFILGKFTSENSLEDETFYTQQVLGDTLILEYYEPYNVEKKGDIRIAEIGHYYKSLLTKSQSGSCEINVICSEGDNWRDQIRSVVYYEMRISGYIYMCSGALINNVRRDKKQYLLSACHCQEDGVVTRWTFYFNYQTNTCSGTTGVKNQSVTGAVIKAKNNYNDGSDFLLLEITGAIPESYNPYFSGWDRTSIPTVGACIHHPQGDWKKISLPSSVSNGTGSNSKFWNVNWINGYNNKGVTEEGSSGSPLFDANKRIIGQLYGGSSYCDYTYGSDYYGKFSVSWNENSDSSKSLVYWLDPDGTNIQYLDGINISVPLITKSIGKSISVYPNPTNGIIKINTSFLSSKAICKVYNTKGEQVYLQEMSVKDENHINLARLEKGSYIVEIITYEGRYSTQVVLIK